MGTNTMGNSKVTTTGGAEHDNEPRLLKGRADDEIVEEN